MRISKVSIADFGCFKERTVELGPEVNLITAPNGVGKTTLCSAITWAIWGKQLREITLDERSSVTLDFGNTICRSMTGRGESVKLSGQTAMNKTRFLEVIQPIVGEWSAWSRTLWITGDNVAAFSRGTPADRFKHLSEILKAGRYDEYADTLKTVLKSKQALFADQKTWATVEWNRLNRELGTLAKSSHSTLAHLSNQPAVSAEVLKEELEELRRSKEDWSAKVDELSQSYELAKANLETAQKLMQASRVQKMCGECGQSLGATTDAKLQNDWHEANAICLDLNSQLSHAKMSVRGYGDSMSATSGEIHRISTIDSYLNNAEETFLAGALDLLKKIDALVATKPELIKLETELSDLELLIELIQKAKKDYLASAANSIGLVCNSYLAIVGGGFQVSLDYQNNVLNVNLTGSAAKTYKGLSSGQRRRVDICLVLAMSHVAATVGTVPKTAPIIIDEAFDTLDNSGIEALVSLSCEIAKERQVFLVSHADPSVPMGPSVSRIYL